MPVDRSDTLMTSVGLFTELDDVVAATERLAEIVTRSSLRRLSVQVGGVSWELAGPELVVAADGVAVAAASAGPPAPEVPAGHQVTAPLVGVFYRSPGPGQGPFVEVGDTVEAGQQVAIVEAMKMMNEVVADRRGVLTAVHAGDADVVEFGQVLFTISH